MSRNTTIMIFRRFAHRSKARAPRLRPETSGSTAEDALGDVQFIHGLRLATHFWPAVYRFCVPLGARELYEKKALCGTTN